MDNKLLKVKEVFDGVKEMRTEISILFGSLDGRISKLKDVYDEFIVSANKIKTPDVKVFIFSLDSFYFQTSLLEREYKYLIDYKNTIINRMYGEYYKLFKLIIEYVDKSHIDGKLSEILRSKKYPIYDDLNDGKEYDFNLIVQLNEDIIGIIENLIHILREKELSLRQYTTNQNYGLNVNNFVSTFNYEVNVLQEQINLYESYLDFFYHVHEKLLKRLITKISILEAQINADIKFEGGLLSKRKDNNQLFNDMNVEGLSKSAARELRKSIVNVHGNVSPSHSNTTSENETTPNNEKIYPNELLFDIPKTVDMFRVDSIESATSKIFKKYDISDSIIEEQNDCNDSISDEIFDCISGDENNFVIEFDNSEDNEVIYDDDESIDDDEAVDEIFQTEDSQEIKVLLDNCIDGVVEANIEFDVSDNNVSMNGEVVILTSKQKKYLRKKIKKKEKKMKERMERNLDNIL